MCSRILKRSGRSVVVLAVVTLMAGCMAPERGPRASSGYGYGPVAEPRYSPCMFNPGGCLYDGNYERGERDYAEQEARRLNRASLERLRRVRL